MGALHGRLHLLARAPDHHTALAEVRLTSAARRPGQMRSNAVKRVRKWSNAARGGAMRHLVAHAVNEEDVHGVCDAFVDLVRG